MPALLNTKKRMQREVRVRALRVVQRGQLHIHRDAAGALPALLLLVPDECLECRLVLDALCCCALFGVGIPFVL